MDESNPWEKRHKQRNMTLHGSYDVVIPTELFHPEQTNGGTHFTKHLLLKEQNDQLKECCSQPESDSRQIIHNGSSSPAISSQNSLKLHKSGSRRLALLPEPLFLPTISASQLPHKKIQLVPETAGFEELSLERGVMNPKSRRFPGRRFTGDCISTGDLRELNRFSQQLSRQLTKTADIDSTNCQLYTKTSHQSRITRLLYATNQHGYVYTGYTRDQSGLKNEKNICVFQAEESRCTGAKRNTVTASRGLPSLPKRMTSEDFIRSWLDHGSVPHGQSHFPSIHKL